METKHEVKNLEELELEIKGTNQTQKKKKVKRSEAAEHRLLKMLNSKTPDSLLLTNNPGFPQFLSF
jgi:hypothetical protein